MRSPWAVILVGTLIGGAAWAAPSDLARKELLWKMQDVPGAIYKKFDAKDDQGGRMEGAKIIANPEGTKEDRDTFLAIYHNDGNPMYGNGKSRVYLAASDDLQSWRVVSLQAGSSDYPATHPSIKAMPGGGFVVAWEQQSAVGTSLHVRSYENKQQLYNGTPVRAQDCAPSLSLALETLSCPSITAVSRTDVTMEYSQVEIQQGVPVTRVSRGRVSSFSPVIAPSAWTSAAESFPKNAVLYWLNQWSDGSAVARVDAGDGPSTYTLRRNNFGSKVRFSMLTGQLRGAGMAGVSRVFLFDHDTFNADPVWLNIASASYADPSVTTNLRVDGKLVTVVSINVLPEGSAPGEAGQLIYYFRQN